MERIAPEVHEILQRAEEQRKKAATTNNLVSSKKPECPDGNPECRDGYILDGWKARECTCLERKRIQRRLKNAMIPEEFKDASFKTYRVKTSTQELMYGAIKGYLDEFEKIKDTNHNSFGFIAVYGEKKLQELKPKARAEMKEKHNNFGLGKTHLQVAAAKTLIQRGYTTIVISDVAYMGDLSQARASGEDSERFNRLLATAIEAPVLVWDDIGKAKPSEFRLNMYYQIINERYRKQRPIIFSSNEDTETLAEKIGDAAASRLFGMAKNHLYEVEGVDYRLQM